MAVMSRQKLIVGFLIVLLLFIIPQARGTTQQEEGQISIVFDFSHNSTFSVTKRNFTEAVGFFTDLPEYQIRILEDGELTAANLSRSHILVIPNPESNYSVSELEVISDYVNQGGSLFLLSDYQVEHRPIGNPFAVNMILQALLESRIQFSTYTDGNTTEGDAIIDTVNSRIHSHYVEVNNSYLYSQLNRESLIVGIDSLIVAGGSLTTAATDLIISTGAETSEAVTLSGDFVATQPGWLSAFWIGSSRIVLCSSTTMFSDTTCVGTNQSWFQSLDNSVLWFNIFRWMSLDLVQDPTLIMIFFVVLVLVAGFAVFVYSLWRTKRE
ncbi:MAG: hypothetical protein ACXADB_01510 [Candidatus Hermodarchaeia archaeon]|jgi:hypothetical protein